MAELLLSQSYYLRFDPKLWEAMQPYPPLGTLYAAGYLREQGFEVALFDAMLASSTSEWHDSLQRHRPDFAVLYEDSFNYLSKMCLLRMREAAFEMIGQARSSGATVIVSSSDATDHLEEYFARGADYILIGEAEQSLAALLASLTGRSARPADPIAGVAQPGARTGTVPAAGPERDLDRLPFPAWDLVDLDRYRDVWLQRHGYFSLNMVTTRGCPYSCNWCAKPIYGQRYNSRSPENVVLELACLKGLADPDHIWFADDIFGLKKGWIERFSELVCQQDLQTPFKCLLRADLVTKRRAALLRRAGCQTVWVGAESGSQKILDAMGKGTTLEDNLRATRQLQQAGIEVGHFLQFGYPGEGWREIGETVRMLRRSRPDEIGISVSYPLPGTKFFQRVQAQMGDQRNWRDGNDLAMLYRGPFSTRFYRRLHRVLHTEHRARLGWKQLLRGDWKGLK
ncbi:MAG: radical SAM protein, partial [Acidobacteriota bacterium]